MSSKSGCIERIEALVSLRVDKSTATPVYRQIAEVIRGLIRERTLAPGARLPPERVMCERIGISKMTLRQAYGLLEREGILESRRGFGSVVCQPRLDKKLPEMRSFSEEMTSRGHSVSSRVLRSGIAEPSLLAREFFSLSANQKVYDVQRLRLCDDRPIAIERVELPADWLPGLDRFDLRTLSLYRVLEEHYGIQLARCREEISAVRPDRVQKRLLEIDGPVALLVIKRESYAANASPIEISVSAYRGDMYTASVDAMRTRAGAIRTQDYR